MELTDDQLADEVEEAVRRVNVRHPSVVPGEWHKLAISWDGTITKAQVDEVVVAESIEECGGVYFEYDTRHSNSWKPAFDKKNRASR